jgi:hypothetical protein
VNVGGPWRRVVLDCVIRVMVNESPTSFFPMAITVALERCSEV